MRLAAIDVGSNTVQALVVEAGPEGVVEVARHVETVGLGAAVAREGALGERTGEALEALTRVAAQARRDGARSLAVGATAAVRGARDREGFLELASTAAGVPVRLLSEEREARLSFLGVAGAHARPGPWLMADVGGASTELAGARGGSLLWWSSAAVGSGVLAAARLSDPPSRGERAAARRQARARLRRPGLVGQGRLVVTGGTVLYLALLLGRGGQPRLGRGDLAAAAEVLDGAPSYELVGRLSLPLARITALRAGGEILEALLALTGLAEVEVSREGLPHGMALALARHGEDWHLAGTGPDGKE
ncbi:MAG: hypothetical protein ACREPI_12480 [Candidatus Dormibacterales bacterium]